MIDLLERKDVGNCGVHCSRSVLQPLAMTQSATVYINIHRAAIVSAREKRRNGWLFCLVVSIPLFSKKALGFVNSYRAHMSCFHNIRGRGKKMLCNINANIFKCVKRSEWSILKCYRKGSMVWTMHSGLKRNRLKATPYFSTLDSAPGFNESYTHKHTHREFATCLTSVS